MLGRLSKHNKQVGLQFTSDGIAIAEIEMPDGAQPALKSCEFISTIDKHEQIEQLSHYIKANKLKKMPCVAVLEDTQYKLFHLPLPPVEESELKSALRWSIKDLIDFPVEDAVIDVFRVPVKENREEKVYVAVTQRDVVVKTINFFNKIDLTLRAIDIEQLSLGNIIEQIIGQERGIAVIHIGYESGSISLYNNSILYLSRNIDTGLKQLQEIQSPAAADHIYESIILELQRSLDFYVSEHALPQINKLLIAPRHPLLQGLNDFVSNHSGMKVELINLAQIFQDSTVLNDEIQTNCILAIAAASRKTAADTSVSDKPASDTSEAAE